MAGARAPVRVHRPRGDQPVRTAVTDPVSGIGPARVVALRIQSVAQRIDLGAQNCDLLGEPAAVLEGLGQINAEAQGQQQENDACHEEAQVERDDHPQSTGHGFESTFPPQ